MNLRALPKRGYILYCCQLAEEDRDFQMKFARSFRSAAVSYEAFPQSGVAGAFANPATSGFVKLAASQDRLIGVEALRALAAFTVVISHYCHFAFVGDHLAIPVSSAWPFYSTLGVFYTHGHYGVEAFWCISGFIFSWKYSLTIANRGIPFSHFMFLRFTRLYPLHLATLLVVAVLAYLYFQTHGYYFVYPSNDLKHFILNLFFASNWGLQDGGSFNGPVWSVSVEILVYIAFFSACRALGSHFIVNFLIAAGAMSALVVLRRSGQNIRFELLDAVTFFYLGALAHNVRAELLRRPAWMRHAFIILAAVEIWLLGSLMLAGKVRDIWAALLMAPAAVLLFELVTMEFLGALSGLFRALGNLTYASYLLHFPLELAIVLVLDRMGIPITKILFEPWFFVTWLVIVFGLAHLTYHGFERPAQDALRKLRLENRPVRAGA
jgi:peptidoglycan/LPS O-acetylase OafA/YrhL